MQYLYPSRSRRAFILNAAATSVSAILPLRSLAQSKASPSSESDAPQLAVIPQDTRLKFNPDGTRRPFAGNTVICHIPLQSKLHDTVTALSDALRSSVFAYKLGILPNDSFHVTILGGPNDLNRTQYGWPKDIPIEATIRECNRVVGKRFMQLQTHEGLPLRFRLDRGKTITPQLACGLQLVPADEDEKAKLSNLRDLLADEVFLYRASNHASFRFHISIAYQTSGFTLRERQEYQTILEHHVPIIVASTPEIELGVPEYCTFEDMFRFEVQNLLRT